LNIHAIVRKINRELVPQFEEKLRQHLNEQEKEWLIEQIVRLTLDAHSLEENDRKIFLAEKAKKRAERAERLKVLHLNEQKLKDFIERHNHFQCETLMAEGYLLSNCPSKGTDLIEEKFRTEKGNQLLIVAKDLLFGLLFGDESTNTYFNRKEREMLTLVVPRMKADALDFMKATTEMSAAGTWQDPDSVSNDARADNVILEVEFGEIEGEWIGRGIVLALRLINHLEVNEQILYGRMINVEQSTLIE
jgi:hypothetical protein